MHEFFQKCCKLSLVNYCAKLDHHVSHVGKLDLNVQTKKLQCWFGYSGFSCSAILWWLPNVMMLRRNPEEPTQKLNHGRCMKTQKNTTILIS